MDERDLMTDDAKLVNALVRDGLAQPAWRVGQIAGIAPERAAEALARMADWDGDPSYPILRRFDLGPDWYEATEDSAREW